MSRRIKQHRRFGGECCAFPSSTILIPLTAFLMRLLAAAAAWTILRQKGFAIRPKEVVFMRESHKGDSGRFRPIESSPAGIERKGMRGVATGIRLVHEESVPLHDGTDRRRVS